MTNPINPFGLVCRTLIERHSAIDHIISLPTFFCPFVCVCVRMSSRFSEHKFNSIDPFAALLICFLISAFNSISLLYCLLHFGHFLLTLTCESSFYFAFIPDGQFPLSSSSRSLFLFLFVCTVFHDFCLSLSFSLPQMQSSLIRLTVSLVFRSPTSFLSPSTGGTSFCILWSQPWFDLL